MLAAIRTLSVRQAVVCKATHQNGDLASSSFFCPTTKKPWYVLVICRSAPRELLAHPVFLLTDLV
jgi:hypothetical protein